MNKLKRMILLLILFSSSIFAADSSDSNTEGQVNLKFKLHVTESACTVSDANKNFNVDLGTWAVKQFKNANSTSEPKLIEINLENCSFETVQVKFEGNPSSMNSNYLSLNDDSDVTNIAIQLLNSDRTPLNLNEYSPINNIGGLNNPILRFYANYISETGGVSSGKANAIATFYLSYN